MAASIEPISVSGSLEMGYQPPFLDDASLSRPLFPDADVLQRSQIYRFSPGLSQTFTADRVTSLADAGDVPRVDLAIVIAPSLSEKQVTGTAQVVKTLRKSRNMRTHENLWNILKPTFKKKSNQQFHNFEAGPQLHCQVTFVRCEGRAEVLQQVIFTKLGGFESGFFDHQAKSSWDMDG